MLGQRNKAELYWVFLIQWIVAAVIVFIMLIFVGQSAAMSAMYGSTVSLIPTLLFGYMIFRYQGAKQLKNILHSFYIGECLKLFLAVAIFATYLRFFNPICSVFCISFLLVHASFCFAPLVWALRG
ncbi:MAG: hypothetical protein A3F18_01050 [Legionellales bacterium RIFCSPHIGHO2_12_FULL_37_14]|nr:MAG: hypothetical protein A3F18_01050 [Legionellales bacterium RIFCSPHIGHO2_12_FULL_37_14]